MGYGSAGIPCTPYLQPLTPPLAAPADGALYSVSMTGEWWAIVAGACYAMVADSSWDIQDLATMNQTRKWAWQAIRLIDARKPIMDLRFRVNPSHPQNLDFSIDGGVTYNLTADTAVHITPEFLADSAAPAGYDLTVNGGYTQLAIPLLTAVDPNAVIKDPATSADNVITAVANTLLTLEVAGTATGIEIAAGADTIPALLSLLALL